MKTEEKNQTCKKCKTFRFAHQFLKEGRVMSTCILCRGYSTKYRINNLCIHKKQKATCKECKGSQICIHNKIKFACKDCKGAQICIHNKHKGTCRECQGTAICIHDKQKSHCKECGDPIKLTIRDWLKNSKISDLKYNRHDPNIFIDKLFLEDLVEEYPNCYWSDCKVKLQYVIYQDDLATIERTDNSIGHSKDNCVIACSKCNHMKKSNNQIQL